VPNPEKLGAESCHWENNIQSVFDAGKKMGVPNSVLQAKDMANIDVEHLGVMAYATQLQWINPRAPLADMLKIYLESTSGRVGESV
jgi:filamin